MKLLSKISILALSVTASVILGASGGYHYEHKHHENVEDAALNGKLVELKHKIEMQKAGPTEAGELFSKSFPSVIEGTAKVSRIWFADGDTSVVITDSPIPMRLLFKGQFLMDNQMLKDKVGKVIKFKVSNFSLVEEPILETLRHPFTDSPFWIHATFSNYGKGNEGDFIDSIKPSTIPY
jgi:hypothetical protein